MWRKYMLVNAKKMLEEALNEKYAICHFNINNLEWTRFILEECEINKAPVILGVSEGAARYMGGYKTVFHIVDELIKYLNITVPVALHLDHGSSFDTCKEAIDAGFTSVMIDASSHNLEKNIEITKEVVKYAKKYNVSVEAEIGRIGGNEDGITSDIIYADIDECK
jgi:ketose-bisphosphate aldolase